MSTEPKKRPTIAELEAILNANESKTVEVLPDGSIVVNDELTRLRTDLDAARAEAERAALWAAHLKLHLGELQRKVADFVRGASPAEWRHKEPRIVGFGLEFEEMKRFAALKDPEPPPADATSESRCAALAKECEELRKDRERLEWLLKNAQVDVFILPKYTEIIGMDGHSHKGDTIRAAIDAACATPTGGAGENAGALREET